MAGNKFEVIISDLPAVQGSGLEYLSKTQLKKFDRDIRKLIQNDSATFQGRAWNQKNGSVYQIFSLADKQIMVEDPDGTATLKSLFDRDGRLREMEIR